jgi:hypothetical protein
MLADPSAGFLKVYRASMIGHRHDPLAGLSLNKFQVLDSGKFCPRFVYDSTRYMIGHFIA